MRCAACSNQTGGTRNLLRPWTRVWIENLGPRYLRGRRNTGDWKPLGIRPTKRTPEWDAEKTPAEFRRRRNPARPIHVLLSGNVIQRLVGVTGFEPATSASQRQRSAKLSYTPICAENRTRLPHGSKSVPIGIRFANRSAGAIQRRSDRRHTENVFFLLLPLQAIGSLCSSS